LFFGQVKTKYKEPIAHAKDPARKRFLVALIVESPIHAACVCAEPANT
jgi:hypothetical protein